MAEDTRILGVVELRIKKESLALLVLDVVYRYVWLLSLL